MVVVAALTLFGVGATPVSAEPEPPPRQLRGDVLGGHLETRGEPLDDHDEGAAVGFDQGGELLQDAVNRGKALVWVHGSRPDRAERSGSENR